MDAPDTRPAKGEEVKEVSPPDQERLETTEDREKHRRPGRLLAVFKGLVMLSLLAVTVYGMMRDGLYLDEFWLPVAAGVLALLFATLFVRGFYVDLPPAGTLALAFLAALVAVKGLSMVWTISETETIKETLRSSMYLAIFVMAMGALTSWRQVGPLIDFSVLVVASVAGYGLLQKINPIDYPVQSIDGVRMDSTLGYANTTAVIIGMGVVLPGAWLWWRIQSLPGLLETGIRPQDKLADGTAFRNELILALLVAFALQAGFTLLMNRYELAPAARRVLGIIAVAGLVLVACAGTFVVVGNYGGPAAAYQTLLGNADESDDIATRLASLDISSRGDYWRVGWEAWKERPFTGTGAGTFQFTWLEDRPSLKGVKQVHNLYLEQGTETGIFAFLALLGF